jgi:hypothetical protein
MISKFRNSAIHYAQGRLVELALHLQNFRDGHLSIHWRDLEFALPVRADIPTMIDIVSQHEGRCAEVPGSVSQTVLT